MTTIAIIKAKNSNYSAIRLTGDDDADEKAMREAARREPLFTTPGDVVASAERWYPGLRANEELTNEMRNRRYWGVDFMVATAR